MTGGGRSPTDAPLTAIWAALRDGIVVVGPDGRVRYANDTSARALDAPPTAAAGAVLHDVAPWTADAPFAGLLEEVRHGGDPASAAGFVGPSDSWCTVHARAVGDDVVLVLVYADIVRVERQRDIAKRLGAIAPSASGFDDAVRLVVATIRDTIGYDVGEAWLRSGGGRSLRLLTMDHADRSELVRFADESRVVEIRDEDLEPILRSPSGFAVYEDLRASQPFTRDHGPDAAGLRSGFQVAVRLGGEIVILLGFFSSHPTDEWPSVVAGMRPLLQLLLQGPWLASQLERYFDVSSDICLLASQEGVVLRVNPMFERVLGWRSEEVVGRSATPLLHPDDTDVAAAMLAEVIASDRYVAGVEARWRTAAGDYRWLSWSASFSRPDGVVYAAARDVTEQHLDRALRDARDRTLTAIVSGEPTSSMLADVAVAIERQEPHVWVSIALVDDDTGTVRSVIAPSRSPDEIDRLAAAPLPDLDRVDGRLREGLPLSRDGDDWHVPIRGSGGELLGVLTVHAPGGAAVSDRLLAIVAVAAQTTAIALERAHAREQLERHEERLRFVVDATSDVVWDWDLLTGKVWRSEQSPLLSIPDDTLDAWAARVHPDDLEATRAAEMRAIEEGERFFTLSYRFRRTDGTYADVTDECVVIRDGDGRATRVIGGMSDMTEQRHRERRAMQLQRMESIGQLAGGIAHDLNNTLAPVLLAVDLLRHTELPVPATPLVDQIDRSVHRAAATVRQMLTFARGTDGERQPVAVRDVVETVAQLVRDAFPKGIELRTAVDDGLPAVCGDPNQLHQVLLNLAVNARDAMDGEGLLTIVASLVAPEDRIGLSTTTDAAAPLIRIDVTDTGPGIAPEVRDRLFEPFFTTKPAPAGTGLGLPTSAAIVERHGGSILVHSDPGHGATFTVVLPASDAAPLADPPAASPDPVATGALVLVVDDEVSILTITEALLRRAGYDVATASDAGAALAVLDERPVAVVVTDVMMPATSGVELIRRIHDRTPGVPVIAVTGLGETVDDLDELATVDVRAVLPKPFRADALLGALADALDGGHDG